MKFKEIEKQLGTMSPELYDEARKMILRGLAAATIARRTGAALAQVNAMFALAASPDSEAKAILVRVAERRAVASAVKPAGAGAIDPEVLQRIRDNPADVVKILKQATFTLETVAHLRGLEAELLPLAELMRAMTGDVE
jgi:3-oxoacyl-ACP reductase-like protein